MTLHELIFILECVFKFMCAVEYNVCYVVRVHVCSGGQMMIDESDGVTHSAVWPLACQS